jgi:hypothetical protein
MSLFLIIVICVVWSVVSESPLLMGLLVVSVLGFAGFAIATLIPAPGEVIP